MNFKLLSVKKIFLEIKKDFLVKENIPTLISGILGLIVGFAWILISGLNLVEGNIVGLAMSLLIFVQVLLFLIGPCIFSGALESFLSYFSGLLIGAMLSGSMLLVINFANWLLAILY